MVLRLCVPGRATYPKGMAARRPVEISSPSQAIKGCEVKIASLYLALTGTLAIAAAPALGQSPSAGATKNVSRTTKAVNYRRAGAAKIDFQGTELMQQANGEARSRTRAAARKSTQNSSVSTKPPSSASNI